MTYKILPNYKCVVKVLFLGKLIKIEMENKLAVFETALGYFIFTRAALSRPERSVSSSTEVHTRSSSLFRPMAPARFSTWRAPHCYKNKQYKYHELGGDLDDSSRFGCKY